MSWVCWVGENHYVVGGEGAAVPYVNIRMDGVVRVQEGLNMQVVIGRYESIQPLSTHSQLGAA